MDSTKILSMDEIRRVVQDLRSRATRDIQARRGLAIFRLSCCCGLRAKEIVGLSLKDFFLFGPKPYIWVDKSITKGENGKKKSRKVPLWWDSGTKDDLTAWYNERCSDAGAEVPYICTTYNHAFQRLEPHDVGKLWTTCIRVLGQRASLSIHCGRHSFCSHALDQGRSLAEVRDAAGHSDISTTSIYLHAIDRTLPDMFA